MSLHLQITKLDTGDYLVNTIHIVDEDGNMMQMENMDGMNDDENMDDMDGMHDMHNMNDMDKSAKPDTTKMEVDHSSHRGQHQ